MIIETLIIIDLRCPNVSKEKRKIIRFLLSIFLQYFNESDILFGTKG